MPKRVYVGPVAAIETRLDSMDCVVKRGQSVNVSVKQAKKLDRCPDNWAKPASEVDEPKAETEAKPKPASSNKEGAPPKTTKEGDS